MRIDVITIFPEYLEPMRHALLGKAIEDGRLSIGIHNLRDWATDNHKSVDDRPAGGGPGMVMKPEVWGPALDDVVQESASGALTSQAPHKGGLRHDELAGVEKHCYGAEITDPRPLLIVPTPAGEPFSQELAQEFSREKHIVFACGRYEGIDQRVFEDATSRYRVREVSIGDYVLIGGEVAVLAITEATVRLIPGVLGNQESHLDDSFSDGLLEAPSYTRPRTWRGISVPDVYFSGDHKKIAAYRRAQSLRRTLRTRPDLLDKMELSEEDYFLLHSREIHTDLSVGLSERDWAKAKKKLASRLRKAGYHLETIHAETVDLTCEPDNLFGPTVPVMRVLINGTSAVELKDATMIVVAALEKGFGGKIQWYGTTDEGYAAPGIRASCAWQHSEGHQ